MAYNIHDVHDFLFTAYIMLGNLKAESETIR